MREPPRLAAMTDSAPQTATDSSQTWGRVDDEGNIYVKDGDTERFIVQYLAGDPAEGFAMYVRRFEGLEVEVKLLEDRMAAGAVSADDAVKAVALINKQLEEPHAIGDLPGLRARIEGLNPAIEALRERKKAEREERQAASHAAKTKIIEEAEAIAVKLDWRNGVDRLRALLEEWKALPRLSKSADDELWHRFSTARTTYTRQRKAHFVEESARRDEAQKIKEALIIEAEALSTSTEWGETSTAYRDLMQKWRKAGPAPRAVEDKLWKKFRATQDVFFSARDAANAEQDVEFGKNADIKREILIEAEALLPIKSLDAARKTWQSIADRWEAAGKVPRDQIKELEGRIRTVENAIRNAEQNEWKRTDPEKSARADDMISKLEAAIAEIEADIEKAKAAGNDKKVASLTENLASRNAFLDMARQTASDFS